MELDYFVLAGVLLLSLSEALIVVALFSSDWLISDYVGEFINTNNVTNQGSPSIKLMHVHTYISHHTLHRKSEARTVHFLPRCS